MSSSTAKLALLSGHALPTCAPRRSQELEAEEALQNEVLAVVFVSMVKVTCALMTVFDKINLSPTS